MHPNRKVDKQSLYRAKKPLKALTKKTKSEILLPAGSVFMREHGNSAEGLVGISWLDRSAHLKETDLLEYCELVAGPFA